jgi:hypothetical protein
MVNYLENVGRYHYALSRFAVDEANVLVAIHMAVL